jgi:hypothetical protein
MHFFCCGDAATGSSEPNLPLFDSAANVCYGGDIGEDHQKRLEH